MTFNHVQGITKPLTFLVGMVTCGRLNTSTTFLLALMLLPTVHGCDDFLTECLSDAECSAPNVLRTLCLNVAGGLHTYPSPKLHALKKYATDFNAHVLLLQETHNFTQWKGFKNTIVVAAQHPEKPTSNVGAAVVLTPLFFQMQEEATIKEEFRDNFGRAAGIKINDVNNGTTVFLSLYFPAEGFNTAQQWWNTVEPKVQKFCHDADHVVIGGDFNSYYPEFEKDEQWTSLMIKHYPKCHHFTHKHNSTGTQSCLDGIFYTSKNVEFQSATYTATTGLSDHLTLAASFEYSLNQIKMWQEHGARPQDRCPALFGLPAMSDHLHAILDHIIPKLISHNNPAQQLDHFKKQLAVQGKKQLKKLDQDETLVEFLDHQRRIARILRSTPNITEEEQFPAELREEIKQYRESMKKLGQKTKKAFKLGCQPTGINRVGQCSNK